MNRPLILAGLLLALVACYVVGRLNAQADTIRGLHWQVSDQREEIEALREAGKRCAQTRHSQGRMLAALEEQR